MPFGAGKPGIIRRLFLWISSAWAGSKTVVATAVPAPALVVPSLFAARTPDRPAASQDSIGSGRTTRSVLPARLRVVAAQNAPSAIAGPRRKRLAPAGKAIPKKQPRVLKRYKRGAPTSVISARLRILKLTTLRPTNVIELASALRSFRTNLDFWKRAA